MGTHQIVAEQKHTFISSRDGEHEDGADGWENRDTRNDKTLPLGFRGEPAGSQNSDDLDHAEGDIEENGLKAIVPKGLDNEISETGNSTTRDSFSLSAC